MPRDIDRGPWNPTMFTGRQRLALVTTCIVSTAACLLMTIAAVRWVCGKIEAWAGEW